MKLDITRSIFNSKVNVICCTDEKLILLLFKNNLKSTYQNAHKQLYLSYISTQPNNFINPKWAKPKLKGKRKREYVFLISHILSYPPENLKMADFKDRRKKIKSN